ncbi:hypothetical protein IYR97_25890 (plasmid) [Pseudomonas fulva]|uniref:Uncharacterized protein n=4 Tax=Pseudomonas TaxID=286 RepID=A0AAJ5V5Q1_9PSED|nr:MULTISPECIES: hypothetical protein [Pseudomonas]QDQ70598.1 hypothetical protein pJBCL41_00599 [Pseudomonas sp.]MCT8162815.1 hypothetical protein [Pseudomonas sp. HD6422]MCT8181416.1 hypothetical protein [Pseudomonas sp. HD6421]MDH1928992.1 hypothetical protein [Pseudomonas sp. GD03696]MDM1712477.1 hypothetical protein [Pseudomonas sp. 165]
MITKSVLVFEPGLGVAMSIDGLTAIELAQYAMGHYESLFKTLPVTYPEGKTAFLIDVLCNGYTECERVTAWSGVPEVIDFDFEKYPPTTKAMLDHDTFGDVHALKHIMIKFTNTL